jgi:hypothetical protein
LEEKQSRKRIKEPEEKKRGEFERNSAERESKSRKRKR